MKKPVIHGCLSIGRTCEIEITTTSTNSNIATIQIMLDDWQDARRNGNYIITVLPNQVTVQINKGKVKEYENLGAAIKAIF